MEKRSKIISIRVQPTLLEQVQTKLNQKYQDNLAKVKNRRNVQQTSVADVIECALYQFLRN